MCKCKYNRHPSALLTLKSVDLSWVVRGGGIDAHILCTQAIPWLAGSSVHAANAAIFPIYSNFSKSNYVNIFPRSDNNDALFTIRAVYYNFIIYYCVGRSSRFRAAAAEVVQNHYRSLHTIWIINRLIAAAPPGGGGFRPFDYAVKLTPEKANNKGRKFYARVLYIYGQVRVLPQRVIEQLYSQYMLVLSIKLWIIINLKHISLGVYNIIL